MNAVEFNPEVLEVSDDEGKPSTWLLRDAAGVRVCTMELTDEQATEFCIQNPDLSLER